MYFSTMFIEYCFKLTMHGFSYGFRLCAHFLGATLMEIVICYLTNNCDGMLANNTNVPRHSSDITVVKKNPHLLHIKSIQILD